MDLISIVIPCYNEAKVLPYLFRSLSTLIDEIQVEANVELILVDDGSRDDTWDAIAAFAKLDSRVRAFRLSRNFGHQAAITCGYEEALGDAVICMDADLQDPPDVVHAMISKWREGADIVLGKRIGREGESGFKIFSAYIFYRLIRRLSEVDLPEDVGDFRLLSRRSVNAFNKLGERRRYLRGMVAWLGFQTEVVEYVRKPRTAGEPKYSLAKSIALALDGLVSFSLAPLRLSFFLAIAASTPFLIYFSYSLINHIFFHGTVEKGWMSIMLAITLFGTVNLFCLGIIGEYIGRIYYEAKSRPIYLLAERMDSADLSSVHVRSTVSASGSASEENK